MSLFLNILPSKVKITGLTTSVWNTVDLNAFSVIPAGATYAFIESDIPGSTGANFAMIDGDATTSGVLLQGVGRMRFREFLKLSGNNVQLYCSNLTASGGTFNILGYTNYITPLGAPIDVTSQVVDANSDLVTIPGLPPAAAGGAVLLNINTQRSWTFGLPNRTQFLPYFYYWVKDRPVIVDATYSFFAKCSGRSGGAFAANSLQIKGWLPPGAYVPNVLTPTAKVISAGAWQDLPYMHPGVVGDFQYYYTDTTALIGIEAGGNSGAATTYNWQESQTWGFPNPATQKVAAYTNATLSGYSAGALLGDDVGVFFMGYIPPVLSAKTFTLNKAAVGETTTITFSGSVSAVSKIILNDGDTLINITTGITGAGTSWSFTWPDWVSGTASLRNSTIQVTVIADGEFTAPVNITQTKTNYTTLTLAGVSSIGLSSGITPPLAKGDELVYDPTKAKFNNMAIGAGDFVGTQTVWYLSAADKKRYSFVLQTNGSSIININDLVANHSSPIWDGGFPLGNRP
jgi:hypothetical protein